MSFATNFFVLPPTNSRHATIVSVVSTSTRAAQRTDLVGAHRLQELRSRRLRLGHSAVWHAHAVQVARSDAQSGAQDAVSACVSREERNIAIPQRGLFVLGATIVQDDLSNHCRASR